MDRLKCSVDSDLLKESQGRETLFQVETLDTPPPPNNEIKDTQVLVTLECNNKQKYVVQSGCVSFSYITRTMVS